MSTNSQPTNKPDHRKDGWLHLHHVFPTIQGEGPFAGWPSVFVRLFGCNLQCPACDTDYTSRDDLVRPELVLGLVNKAGEQWSDPLVVITGGEPFRQNIVPLIELLLSHGYKVQIETNGTLWIPNFPDRTHDVHVICSPKTPRINYELAMRANAFKYVLQAGHVDGDDGLPTDTMLNPGHNVARPPVAAPGAIYVQPLDETMTNKKFPTDEDYGELSQMTECLNAANLQAAVESCMKYGYRLSVQTHKIANLE